MVRKKSYIKHNNLNYLYTIILIYIGAELTSTFKNRDYKIYSNIVTKQLETQAKRMLLIIGVAHIGSLKSILRDDDFITIDTKAHIKK
ncbi:DUF5694 domain-containing protein [Pedobacter lithocola]|uniref:DUF5694 domain-containing protein n=1 Tax=Pedobacter lithocola TaxID=1908239 RepID=A0ABV8PFE2_9SPHI